MAVIPKKHHHPTRAPRPHCPHCGGDRIGNVGKNLVCVECGQKFGASPRKNPTRKAKGRKPTTAAGAQLARGQWVNIPGGAVRITKKPQGQALEYKRKPR
jgi:hypothetical protein